MTPAEVKRTSKWLSRHLRHESKLVTPDRQGWVDLSVLLSVTPPWLSRLSVERAVSDNDKQRFTIEGERIRANQGHSISVDLDLVALFPPEFLFHGTNRKVVDTIMGSGLSKMKRHHVHMSTESGTAMSVGRRTGAPVLLKVLAQAMHQQGFSFFCSLNGVWLTEHVPPEYLEVVRWA
jgi:putative RNA 2'-phosphotransferase